MITLPNIQPSESLDQREDGSLDVHSIFPTIQGEGIGAGQPALFIRLAGCNFQCPSCDTEYTLNRKRHTVSEILDKAIDAIKGYSIHLVVITGGEPFRQNITPLVNRLLDLDFSVQVETNGTLCLEIMPDNYSLFSVMCSPKGHKVNPNLADYITCYKYVIKAGEVDSVDGLPTKVLGLNHPPARPHDPNILIIIQPMDEQDIYKNAENARACVQSAMKHGHIIGVQLHKYLEMP